MKKTVFLAIILICALTGCGESESEDKSVVIYYLDKAQENIVSEETALESDKNDTSGILSELEKLLETNGSQDTYVSPIEPDIEFDTMELKNNQLSMYFTGAYNNKSGVSEILSRAAIVKTMCQIDGVDKVEFFVEDQSLMIRGVSIGQMDDNSFVEDLGDQGIPQSRMVRLYFGDSTGQRLVPVDTTVTYPAAEKLAKLLVDCLIAGPEALNDVNTEGLVRTIPKTTVLNSVTIRDNICYLDLSREFSELIPSVSSDVTVYSIVDTLCELPSISKVQFSIDSGIRERYGETAGFNTAMERDLDIISEQEETNR